MVASDKMAYDYDEAVLAIDKILLTKRRLLTEDFLREIIVLSHIYSHEEIIKNGLENALEQDREIDGAVETFGLLKLINYTPEPL